LKKTKSIEISDLDDGQDEGWRQFLASMEMGTANK